MVSDADLVRVAPSTHAKRFPPSSMKAILLCHGFKPSGGSSTYANEGTAAHELAQDCLNRNVEAYDLIGTKYLVEDEVFEVTPDMARFIQEGYIRPLKALADGFALRIEQKLNLAPVTGENSTGTADAVILKDRAITIADLKYGMGIKVDAEHNEQLMTYALAAIAQYGHITGPIDHVDLMIFQPRLKHVSEWRISRFDLEAWGVRLAITIDKINHGIYELNPGAAQCKYCARASSCEALNASVFEAAQVDFDDQTAVATDSLDDEVLAKKLSMVDAIRTWCDAVEAESRRRLMAGRTLPGFKVVQGRKGTRKWVDEEAVETLMKKMRFRGKNMYEMKLISPTTAEKYAKYRRIGPVQWKRLCELLTQSEGKPSIVPESDPRPALVTDPAADFSAISSTPE